MLSLVAIGQDRGKTAERNRKKAEAGASAFSCDGAGKAPDAYLDLSFSQVMIVGMISFLDLEEVNMPM